MSAYFENCFEINVNIFPLKQDESVLSIFQSKGKFSNVMYSNLFDNRLSHNSNFKAYARKFQCKCCKHHFDRVDKCHQRAYAGKAKRKFPGGLYSKPLSVLDKLAQIGVCMEEKDQPLRMVLSVRFRIHAYAHGKKKFRESVLVLLISIFFI